MAPKNLILTYSDIHFRDCGSFPPFNQIDSNGLTKELNNILTAIDFIAECVLKYKPKILAGLGDTVQVTEFQTAQTLHGMYLAYKKLRDVCRITGTEHWYFDGNHDILNENKQITNTGLLEAWVDKFIKESCIIALSDSDVKVGCIPYSSNTGTVHEKLISFQDHCVAILTHKDFAKCRYESGVESQSYLTQIGGCLLLTEDRKVTRIPNKKSKHYVRIHDKDLESDEKMASLPAANVCLQVITTWPIEKLAERLKGYDYHYIPEFAKSDDSTAVHYSHVGVIDPLAVMKTYVQEDNPNTLPILEEIFKEKQGDSASNTDK